MFENFDGTPCIVKNCKSDVVTRGLCRSHYNLFIRGGLHRIIIEPLPSTKTITKKSVCSKTRDVNKPITKKKILYGMLGLEGMAEKEWRAFFLFPSLQKGYKDGKCRDCGQPYGQPHIKFSELYTQGNKRNKTRTLTPADELQKQKYIDRKFRLKILSGMLGLEGIAYVARRVSYQKGHHIEYFREKVGQTDLQALKEFGVAKKLASMSGIYYLGRKTRFPYMIRKRRTPIVYKLGYRAKPRSRAKPKVSPFPLLLKCPRCDYDIVRKADKRSKSQCPCCFLIIRPKRWKSVRK